MTRSKLIKWGAPLAVVLLLAPFTPMIDLKLANRFYTDSGFSSHPYFSFIYHYGVYPAFLVGISSACLFIASFFKETLLKYRFPCLFLAVAMLCGPGLMINLFLKGFFMRPRPVQILNFGGTELFKPFYNLTFSYPNPFKSFPSGHSTMGFYFFNLIFLGQRLKNLLLVRMGAMASIFLGLSLSISRIAQGGHFFSDTLMSLCLIWYIGLFCEWLIFDYLAKKNILRYTKG